MEEGIGGVMPQYLRAGQLATMLEISTKKAYQLLKAGRIPGAFRLAPNEPWFIDLEILTNHLKTLATRPKAPANPAAGNKSRHKLV